MLKKLVMQELLIRTKTERRELNLSDLTAAQNGLGWLGPVQSALKNGSQDFEMDTTIESGSSRTTRPH